LCNALIRLYGKSKCSTAVAVGHALKSFARRRIKRKPSVLYLFGALEQLLDRFLIKGFENQHARTRKQRRIQFERRVFGGGADQNNGAVLHYREKTVLLGAVEAMNLVDK